jgi:hypothetical protein
VATRVPWAPTWKSLLTTTPSLTQTWIPWCNGASRSLGGKYKRRRGLQEKKCKERIKLSFDGGVGRVEPRKKA